MTSKYQLLDDFYLKLSNKYDSAIKGEHILFNGDSAINEIEKIAITDENDNQSNTTATTTTTTTTTTIDVQLTLLKSLMHRPEIGTKPKNESSQNLNPFLKPEPELTIVDNYNDDEFKIVFNKFPVVPRHFMLITKEFKSQNTPLSPSELMATYKILQALKNQNQNQNQNQNLDQNTENWFAFYNCGPESGASQPHKHIQFMTLPSREQFKPYAETLFQNKEDDEQQQQPQKIEPKQNKDLPFAHFFIPIVADDVVDEEELPNLFSSILQKTLTELRETEQTHISYNFIMTLNYMLMIPRSKGKYGGDENKDEDKDKDKLGINSCGFQGLILCKNQELFDLVKSVGPLQILKDVGLPNSSHKTTTEYDY